jgi:5-methylcytosine-specific restriction endonuclease McrA
MESTGNPEKKKKAAKIETVKQHLFWAYANLAMAHFAIKEGHLRFGVPDYSIRAKLYKGLCAETMQIRSLLEDEKVKLTLGTQCNYCNAQVPLSIDHVVPKYLGGADSGDNLIYACKSCNSSKGKKDLMEWMNFRDEFLPLMVIRRYLKLCIYYCLENDLMDKNLSEVDVSTLPFKLHLIPLKYPRPSTLKLT